MPLKRNDQMCCKICKRWIRRKGLYRHMKEIHQYTQDQIDNMKKERQEAHPENLKVLCPICGGKFVDHERLANHCAEEHSRDGANGTQQDYTVYSRRFPTKDEFEIWLQEQCGKTASKLYQRAFNGRWHTLRCSRAGRSTSQGAKQSPFSKKDVSHCPCFANYVVNYDESISVKGCFGHAGHDVEPAPIRVRKRQKPRLTPLLEDHYLDSQDSQERLERRMSLRNNIQLSCSMVSSNINALVNIDTEEALAKLTEIYELIDKASKIRMSPESQKPEIVVQPKLPRQGPKHTLKKTKCTRQKYKRKRDADNDKENQ